MSWILRVQKANFREDPLQVCVKVLHLLGGRGRRLTFEGRARIHKTRDTQFVGQDLDCHCEVQ